MTGLEIRAFREDLHLPLVHELTRLLHQAYSPLASEGLHYVASHQPPEKTLERLLEGSSWIFFFEEQLVGTVSLYEGVKKRMSADYYRNPGVYLFGQFAIRPEHQGKGWGTKVMDFLEDRARELGARELALDTSEHATRLISMYERRGYKIVSATQWPTVNYRSLILSKAL